MLNDFLKAIRASQALHLKTTTDMAAVTKAIGGKSSLLEAVRVSQAARQAVLASHMTGVRAFSDLNADGAAMLKAVAGASLPKMSIASAAAAAQLASVGGSAGILASMTSVQGYLSRVTSQYNAIFSSPAFRDVVRRWREALELKTEFAVVMSQLGWPPPKDLPPQVMRRIVDEFQGFGDEPDEDAVRRFVREVERKVLKYYNGQSVREKLGVWSSKHLLARRFHILEAAVNAHCRGDHWLSVPVLLAQAEGIVADGFNHKGRMNGDTYTRYRAELFETIADDLVPEAVNEALIEFCVSVVYVAFAHGEPVSSTLSRHAILHGGDVGYGTEANSLKVLLFIDFLQDSFRLTVLENSDIYHSDDCVALARSTSRGRSFKRLDEVLSEGKRPCRRCLPPN